MLPDGCCRNGWWALGFPQSHRQRSGDGIMSEVSQITLQQLPTFGGCPQQPVHPAPGFSVVVLRHCRCVFKGFKPLEVGLPGALQQPAGEMGGMSFVQAHRRFRQFEELGQSLIQPERQPGNNGMQVPVRRLVS